MAGNNSIRLLRGNTAAIAACTATSLAGQPLYDIEAHVLYVGDGITPINQLPHINETDLPVASETQFGTVKVYTDGEGYLCIDTE